jgi:hypothetical protein
MKKFLVPLAALVACLIVSSQSASAQDLRCGAGFGGFTDFYGFNYNRAGFERPPHFALFPPVYYSNEIVRRPTGVSPFAVPPGVTPVEYMLPASPQRIVNPHYQETMPPPSSGEPAPATGSKLPVSGDSDT